MSIGGGLFGLASGLAFGKELSFRQDSQLGIRIFHAEGQCPLGQQNLTGLGGDIQRDAQKRGEVFAPQHFLQQLRPTAGAAQHQTGEIQPLIMGKIAGGGVRIATIAGQLLGGHGQQVLGTVFLRIGAATEGVHIYHAASGERGAEVIPLAHIVAQLAGHDTALQQTVQLHAHFLGAAMGPATQVTLIA